ncbi:MAG: NAD(P)/FAD-dependent oxidoreductase, partial [Bacteroidales bacterium]
MKTNDVAIIGAGPAGIACTIQLSRYGIMPLLFERDIPGGLLKNANLVENYPGFPGGIKGTKLIEKMTRQLDMAQVTVIHENVTLVSCKEDLFRIKT